MNRTNSARRRVRQTRGRTRTAGSRRNAENRALARLVICGAAFVLLVAVKLLFPGAISALARSAGQLIGRDADFRAAFAAMGRAVSGEAAVSDSLQDAYTAVFSPSGQTAARPEPTAGVSMDPGVRLMRYTVHALSVREPEPAMTETVVETGSSPAPPSPVQAPAGEGTQEPPPAAPAAPEPAPPPEEPDDTATTEALSYVYTMPAMPENASLEQRNLGFVHGSPVHGSLRSTFGWREHPVEGGSKFHYGVDLAAEEGTDILAFADGTVYASGESSTLGNYIMLQHQGGYITLYAHCSKVTATGGAVARGDKIGEVGATGLATGPHLHFELHDGALYLNPIYYVEIG